MAAPLLQLSDVALTFGGAPLLDGVELSVRAGRAALPRRPQRIGQVDLAQDRRRPRRARSRRSASCSRAPPCAICRKSPIFPGRRRRSPMSKRGSARPTIPSRRAVSSRSSGSRARRSPKSSRAERRAAPPSRALSRLSPISSFSTSRPTISISRPSNGSKPSSLFGARRSSSSAMTGASSPICRAPRSGSIAGRARRIDRGFAAFEAWRDEILAEEERERHKLDRKLVAEADWLRYGVTARRKRNVRRLEAPSRRCARRGASTRARPARSR